MATATATPALARAVRALAGMQNDARADDNRGYSGSDERLGTTLACIPAAAWGPQAERAAWEMLAKYRRQLADLGVAYDHIPEPPQAETEGGRAARFYRSIYRRGEKIVVAASWHNELTERLRALERRTFDRDTKEWLVDPTPANVAELARIASEFTGFGVEPGALHATDRDGVGEGTKPAPPVVEMVVRDKQLLLFTPPPSTEAAVALVAEVKAIPGRAAWTRRRPHRQSILGKRGRHNQRLSRPASVKNDSSTRRDSAASLAHCGSALRSELPHQKPAGSPTASLPGSSYGSRVSQA